MSIHDRISRWFPTRSQLGTPEQLERSFRQMLTQHYELQRQVDELKAKQAAPAASATGPAPAAASGSPPGCGPADSQLLGLPVAPIDANTLANGATLKWNAATKNFSFQ